jgi:hypothetical protein
MKEKKVMNAPPTGKSTPPPKAKAKALIQKKVLEKTTMTSATKKEQKKTTARPKATADVTIDQKISKNNNSVSEKEGEEGDEFTSKGKVFTTPKGQGEGSYQTKNEIEDCYQENKQCTTCNCNGIHWTKEVIADSVEEHPGVIPSNQHYAKHCSNHCK